MAAKYSTGGRYAVLSSTALVERGLVVAVGGADDASLGVADEVDDVVLFHAVGEALEHFGATVGDVESLEVDGLVDVLDHTDRIAIEAPATQAHEVDARVCDRIAAAKRIRGDVLVDLAGAAYHGVSAYAAELMHLGASAYDGPVIHVRLSGYAYITHEYAVVAHAAVVRYMYVGHDESVAAYLGDSLAAGLGAAVDGSALAYGDMVADLYVGDLSVKFEVLGNGPHYCSGEDFTAFAHLDIRVDDCVGVYLAAVSYHDIVVNECIGPDFDILAEDGTRVDRCKRMDFCHNSLVFDRFPYRLGGQGIDRVT